MADFFASLLDAFYKASGSMAGSVLVYTAIFFAILIPFTKQSIHNVIVSPLMEPDLAYINKHTTAHTLKSKDAISRMLVKYHYVIYASLMATLFELIGGLILAIAFKSQTLEIYDCTFLGASLKRTVLDAYSAFDDTSLVPVVACIIALVFQRYNDMVLETGMIGSQKTEDIIALVIIGALCLFLPTAFSIYWAVFEVIDLLANAYFVMIRREKYTEQQRIKIEHKVKKEEKEARKNDLHPGKKK